MNSKSPAHQRGFFMPASYLAFMKHLLLQMAFLTLSFMARAQTATWQQALAFAQPAAAQSEAYATATNVAGEVYVAGSFSGTLTLGATTLTSAGDADAFVAKWSPATSSFTWAIGAGGTGADAAYSLAVQGANVYLTGSYGATGATFGTTQLASYGGLDMFVARLTDAGASASFGWVRHAGGATNDVGRSVAVLGTSVYVGGFYFLPTTTATAMFGALALTSQGDVDGYVTKLVDTGATTDFVWALPIQGTRADAVNSIAATATGVYAAGSFSSAVLQLGTVQLTNAAGQDGYVARLTDAGTTASVAWATSVGGGFTDYIYTVAASGTNVYVAGAFGSPSLAVGSTTLTQAGIYTAFVAKLTDANTAATFQWARQLGNGQSASITKLLVQGAKVFTAGSFSSPTLVVGSTTLRQAGSYDGFVTRLTDTPSGPAFAWALAAGGPGYDQADAVALSPTGALYVSGVLYQTATFGNLSATGASGGGNGFLAGLRDASLLAATPDRALAPTQLFPNPARHTATLRLLPQAAPASLTLTDALGRAARTFPAPTSPESTLDLRGLPAGLYLLHGAGPAQRLAIE
jgi:hypothetical protein